MDWANEGIGNRNPVVILNDEKGIDILTMKSQQGQTIVIDASKSFDPDGDQLTFKWWILPEAGTYTQNVNISNSNSSVVTLDVPSNAVGKSFHLICEVTDNGTHNLSALEG